MAAQEMRVLEAGGDVGTVGLVEEEFQDEVEIIDKLAQLGVSAADIKKAKESGYHTVKSLLMTPKKHLWAIKGLSEAKVEKMVDAAMRLSGSGFITCFELLEKKRSVLKISTGCQAIDSLVGGIETQSVTEIYGEFKTGKTQLCATVCVTTQLPSESGGAAGKVCYIDTEGAFRPERIAPIAERYGMSSQDVLSNIVYARAHTSDGQMDLINESASLFAAEPFRLLVIDSISALFRVDYIGRGELAERQQKLGAMLSKLKKLAEEYNIAVLLTNQVMADPSGQMFVMDPKKHVGGHIMAHASTCRFMTRKGKGDTRVLKVIQHPCVGESEAVFQITDGGIVDAQD